MFDCFTAFKHKILLIQKKCSLAGRRKFKCIQDG